MSASKHTRGPCTVVDRGPRGWAVHWDGTGFFSWMPDERTARVMAAAPALLEALEAIREHFKHERSAPASLRKMVDAALQAARGSEVKS